MSDINAPAGTAIIIAIIAAEHRRIQAILLLCDQPTILAIGQIMQLADNAHKVAVTISQLVEGKTFNPSPIAILPLAQIVADFAILGQTRTPVIDP